MKIRWSNFWLLFLIYGGLLAQSGNEITDTLQNKQPDTIQAPENIFDYAHSKKFAEYLFKTGQYDYAIEEFQRVLFLNPKDWQAKYKIVQAYLKRDDYFHAAGYFHQYFSVFDTLKPEVQKAGIVAHLFLNELDTANKLLQTSNLDSIQKQTWILGIYLLKKDWNEARQYYKRHMANPSPVYHQFGTALQRRLEAKTKSPFVAGALSAVVPGLGKVYTKNYGDALIAFLFTGLNVWQAYRGFHKEGLKSTRGWIFGTLGLGFYLGNIYGSAKAAKRYNKRIDDEIEDEIKSVIKFDN